MKLNNHAHSVTALLILNSDGSRVAVRYFDDSIGGSDGFQTKRFFEQEILKKVTGFSSGRSDDKDAHGSQVEKLERVPSNVSLSGEIEEILHGEHMVLYKAINDVLVAVVASVNQNDLVMMEFAACFYTCVANTLSHVVSYKAALDKLPHLVILMDELVDKNTGCILELDNSVVMNRCSLIGDKESTSVGGSTPNSAQATPRGSSTRPDLSNSPGASASGSGSAQGGATANFLASQISSLAKAAASNETLRGALSSAKESIGNYLRGR